MKYLYDHLTEYCGSDHYPFHMPGHKRQLGTLADPFSFDITEIDGFDNLHHAEGILLEAQNRAARFYGSSETHFLVNGSTCGILSAIGACVPSGRILMSRNCHKAAYHAVMLGGLEAVYLYPQEFHVQQETDKNTSEMLDGKQTDVGINGQILPEDVEAVLKNTSDIKAVFITSPTYDGVVSDVKAIADLAHRYGVPLIVDEAHGAHFGMHSMFPKSSVQLGADVVIHSLHKTLPSLTQTALLHVNGSLVDRRRLRKLLGVYQSSSPSYVLMSSMDQCIRMLEEQGKELFERFASNLLWFYEETGDLKSLKLIKTDDLSKILISGEAGGLSGLEIGDILRNKYHLEVEMQAVNYALALASVGDTREGFGRLARALKEMDEELQGNNVSNEDRAGYEDNATNAEIALIEKAQMAKGVRKWNNTGRGKEEAWQCQAVLTIAQAEQAPQKRILLKESTGHVMGEYIYLYPPGIPLVVPGERMEEALLAQLLKYKEMGYSLQGLEDYSAEYVWVIEEERKR